jgi:glutamyl-tRNA reductase
MDQQFRVVGISHQDTPIVLREKIAFQEATTKDFFKKLKEVLGVNEALLISTCNRTEVYYSSENNLNDQVIKLICAEKGIDSAEIFPFVRTSAEQQSAEYLFRVSLGLESKVLGDIQIINQVKRAYQWSSDEGMAGPFLHRLLHTIFFANKRVVQETSFRDGTGSMASVAVSLIETMADLVKNPKILLIGTGEIGQNVLENLEGAYADITLINRNKERARVLAEANGYRIGDYDKLFAEANDADVIISAVASDSPIISKEHLTNTLTQKLFIDLSVPRSISENVEMIPGVMLYNVDQITEKTSSVLKIREEAIASVERLVDESLNEFLNWSQEMMVSPTIKLLKEKLEQIRQEELARYVNKIPKHEFDQMDSMTKKMLQKVIKLPILELKAACKRGDVDNLVDALHDIFNLERTVADKS